MASSITIVAPTGPLVGSINLPTSKSLCNRLLILCQLADQPFPEKLLSVADDSQLLFKALNVDEAEINVKNAGTAFRFLTAYFAIKEGREVVLTGNAAMKNRPIGPLVKALRTLGADISYTENDGFPPLRIIGKSLKGGSVEMSADVSSQYISALMMIGAAMPQGLNIDLNGPKVSSSYLEMTFQLMRLSGVNVERTSTGFHIASSIDHSSSTFNIQLPELLEPDWSAASYFYGLVALIPGSKLLLSGLNRDSLQGDSRCVSLFEKLGVKSEFVKDGVLISHHQEEVGSYFEYNLNEQPDLVQTLACVHALRGDEVVWRGIGHLRFKETDRITALQNELSKFDVGFSLRMEEDEETWIQNGNAQWNGEAIRTYGDHRMAMAFSLMSVGFSELKIEDAEVVVKSFPGYWEELKRLGFE